MANLFRVVEPLGGIRHVEATERKPAVDFARFLRRLSQEWYADAERIVLVCDNRNTHTPACLYQARRLVERIEWHHTPKHGSWLNVAECERSVLERQCLDQRMADIATRTQEVAAGEQTGNAAGVTGEWQFTTADARVKLKKLYPTVPLQ